MILDLTVIFCWVQLALHDTKEMGFVDVKMDKMTEFGYISIVLSIAMFKIKKIIILIWVSVLKNLNYKETTLSTDFNVKVLNLRHYYLPFNKLAL